MSSFRTTQWSLVFAARNEGEMARLALAELCRQYRAPVLSYVRCLGYSSVDAEDLTQSFFLHLLEKRSDVGADPARGRFRSYLLGALKYFLANTQDASRAAKRGGGRAPTGLDDIEALGVADATASPERAFDRAFAFASIDRAMQHLRAEAATRGKGEQLAMLQEFLLEPRDSGALKALGERLEIRANSLAVTLKRWRDRLAILVREEVAQTVADPALLDAEVAALREALRSPG